MKRERGGKRETWKERDVEIERRGKEVERESGGKREWWKEGGGKNHYAPGDRHTHDSQTFSII